MKTRKNIGLNQSLASENRVPHRTFSLGGGGAGRCMLARELTRRMLQNRECNVLGKKRTGRRGPSSEEPPVFVRFFNMARRVPS